MDRGSTVEASHPSTVPLAYRACELCGHACGVDRRTETGVCGAGVVPRLAAAVIHRGEEPPLSGTHGVGNLFFAGCSLRCRFCQNHEISQGDRGEPHPEPSLTRAMLALQRRGVHAIGLVTASHYAPSAARAVAAARAGGLTVPVIHNTSAADGPAALAALEGHVDIYLPDLKWARADEARRYSGAPWYPEVSRAAIREMARQVGSLTLDADGLATRGLLVRHLVLPDDAAGSLDLLSWLVDDVGPCALSLLRQYRPMFRIGDDPRLARPTTDDEYDEVVEAAAWLGFDPIYVQDQGSPRGRPPRPRRSSRRPPRPSPRRSPHRVRRRSPPRRRSPRARRPRRSSPASARSTRTSSRPSPRPWRPAAWSSCTSSAGAGPRTPSARPPVRATGCG